jgi:bacteriocin biosynthesis cyclodehydratase domain-containing protein
MSSLQSTQYVCLRPEVDITLTAEPGGTATVRGKEVGDLDIDEKAHSVLQAALPLLDGRKTVATIIEHLENRGLDAEDVQACLGFLRREGFVFQFPEVSSVRQMAHYAWATCEPQKILDRIMQSRVVLSGEKDFCNHIIDGLENAGVQDVRYLSLSGGLSEVDEATVSPKDSPEAEHQKPVSWTAWQDLATKADLVILFGGTKKRRQAVNTWCVEEEKPLMTGACREATVSFGPVYVPGVAPCMACREREQNQSEGQSTFSPKAGNPPMVTSAAHLLANLCVEFLSGTGLSESLRARHEVDLSAASFSTHSVLKDPRCDVCGRLNTWPEQAPLNV